MVEESKSRARELAELSLEEKVGQLFTFYLNGEEELPRARKAASEWKAGGIFLDMGILHNPRQVYELTAELQACALEEGSGIPLFLSADLVAGAGCKLRDGGAVHFPKNRAVGEVGDAKLAYESGRITAEESLAMGVNFNYSPVVDVNNNPLNPVIGTHSFGEDPERVARMVEAVIAGYQDNGMVATAKHFPGHGDTQVDSHYALPVLPFDRGRLDRFELAPFRAAIQAGVDAVMVGHIAVPSLDPSQLPASLSYPITTGLLREELGFRGLIVTDGMSMKGITAQFSQAEACVMAVLAGADILLVCPASTEEGQAMIDRVTEAVRQGEISMERLEASVSRILETKGKYGLTREDFRQPAFDPEKLEREDNQKTADELARRALSASNGFAVPAREEAEASPVTLIWDRQVDFFAARLRGRAEIRREHKLDSFAELPGFLAQCEAEEGSWLFALTHNKPIPADVLAALDRFASARPGKVQLVHFGSPYDLAHLSHVPALLLYDRAPSLQKAAADYWEGIR